MPPEGAGTGRWYGPDQRRKPPPRWTGAQLTGLVNARCAGTTLATLAGRYGVSRQHIHHVLGRHAFCAVYRLPYSLSSAYFPLPVPELPAARLRRCWRCGGTSWQAPSFAWRANHLTYHAANPGWRCRTCVRAAGTQDDA
jgi:hypothetical protein